MGQIEEQVVLPETETEDTGTENAELPYKTIDQLGARAGRAALRTISDKLGRQMVHLNVALLDIQEGFNFREQPSYMTYEEWYNDPEYLDIPALAEAIYTNNGPADPLEGDLVQLHGSETYKFYITEGFRRFLAIKHLLAEGKVVYPNETPIDSVEVSVNPSTYTEADRMNRIVTSQSKKHLRPMELAKGLKRYKDKTGASNTEIAAKWAQSRQWVDNMLNLLKLPQSIQDEVNKKTMSIADALALYRKQQAVAKVEKKNPAPKVPELKNPDDCLFDFFTDSNENLIKIYCQQFDLTRGDLENEAVKFNENRTADPKTQEGWAKEFLAYLTEQAAKKEKVDGRKNKEKPSLRDLTGEQPIKKGISALLNSEVDEEEEDDTQEELVPVGDALQPHKPIKFDGDSVHNQEEEANKPPSGKYKDARPAKDQDGDALGKIDFRKEKTEAEMMIAECVGRLDKANIKVSQLPAHLQQYKDDIARLLEFTIKDLNELTQFVKKAPDER